MKRRRRPHPKKEKACDATSREEELEIEAREITLRKLIGEMEEKLENKNAEDNDGYEIPI